MIGYLKHAAVGFLTALLVLFIGFQYYQHSPMLPGQEPLVIDLPLGGNVHDVVKQLASTERAILPRLFRYYVALASAKTPILAGEYNLNPGMTPHGFLNKLQNGDVNVYSATIVEGWTFATLQDRIDQEGSLTHILKGVAPEVLAHKLGLKHRTPEGMFMPTTYHFPAKTTDWEFYQRAYHTMQEYVDRVWPQRSQDCPYHTSYDLLIAASLIEREAHYLPERPMIAAVIRNRLAKKMPLQIDAAVRYGLHAPKRSLTLADLKQKTPYNTYLYQGLPPTPIAMPSASAIDAALHPAQTHDLYYVAMPNGQHRFSRTYQAHLQAVRQYRTHHPARALAQEASTPGVPSHG